MANVRTHVMLSEELLRQLDETVGKGRRSQFIAEAIALKLRNERLIRAIEALEGPVDVEGWEDPDGWVDELRSCPAVGDDRLTGTGGIS